MSSDIAQLEQACYSNGWPFYLYSPLQMARLITLRDRLIDRYGVASAHEYHLEEVLPSHESD